MANKFDRIQENANTQYIIRNCPAYDCSITEWNCLGSDATECKNGDCIIKQIYKLCKDDYVQFGDKELRYDTLEDIIKLLDIQEVE